MELEMADNGTKKNTFYVVNRVPAKGATRQAIKTFLYNPETGAICGRTGISWLKITVFYLIFFTCLGLFSLAMFGLFWKLTIEKEHPRWIGADSLIGTNPGVGFRPMPDQDSNAESTLIWINMERDQTESFWATGLDKFFGRYYDESKPQGKTCTWENGETVEKDKGCNVETTTLPQCAPNSGYGYTNKEGTPCVLIKLNKIFDWKPIHYSGDALPDDMPKSLQEKIKKLTAAQAKELNTTWITCEGENPADRENAGPIEYYTPGSKDTEEFGKIPNYYFPYTMQPDYESPFIFVRFPKPMKSILIQIECKAWAQNIEHNRFLRQGSVHFEIMMDEKS